ncbi:predicted protein [Chaetoceros tenuissimus]|uniref:Uncharacterized protein n=1 Tax=Chaetoceros tenuissimus TaxID=426638 RepID=A0AAD3D340_9STRA|nr:predicted protein [Chaetoceros tenuissimus]
MSRKRRSNGQSTPSEASEEDEHEEIDIDTFEFPIDNGDEPQQKRAKIAEEQRIAAEQELSRRINNISNRSNVADSTMYSGGIYNTNQFEAARARSGFEQTMASSDLTQNTTASTLEENREVAILLYQAREVRVRLLHKAREVERLRRMEASDLAQNTTVSTLEEIREVAILLYQAREIRVRLLHKAREVADMSKRLRIQAEHEGEDERLRFLKEAARLQASRCVSFWSNWHSAVKPYVLKKSAFLTQKCI